MEPEMMMEMPGGENPGEMTDPVAAYREAGQMRVDTAAIAAEHDNLLADLLFE